MTLKLILALDFDNLNAANALVDAIDPFVCALKVGSEMFTRFGASYVKQLINKGFKVFLDLKFHDIPNTVANACKACAYLGVWMLNVHAWGGFHMMQAAAKALEPYQEEAPLLIAVTVLTSFHEEDFAAIGISRSLKEEVKALALLAQSAGLDGVVSSAHEVKSIKKHCGQTFVTVTPGIRINPSERHDQQRIMTPAQALLQGTDYLVVGRSVTRAENPAAVISEIVGMCHYKK
jgi:orotidine-5'-phosphate decarboxylase